MNTLTPSCRYSGPLMPRFGSGDCGQTPSWDGAAGEGENLRNTPRTVIVGGQSQYFNERKVQRFS